MSKKFTAMTDVKEADWSGLWANQCQSSARSVQRYWVATLSLDRLSTFPAQEYNKLPLPLRRSFLRQLSLDQMNAAVDYINANTSGRLDGTQNKRSLHFIRHASSFMCIPILKGIHKSKQCTGATAHTCILTKPSSLVKLHRWPCIIISLFTWRPLVDSCCAKGCHVCSSSPHPHQAQSHMSLSLQSYVIFAN